MKFLVSEGEQRRTAGQHYGPLLDLAVVNLKRDQSPRLGVFFQPDQKH